ncbi:MAG TPA: AI-2E family transporter [Actinomycetota bacterium]|nr:AI-2E family transporter [Actinomycetota bacterium]
MPERRDVVPSWRERWPPASYWMKVAAGVLVVIFIANMLVRVQNVLILLLVSMVLAIGFQPAVHSLMRRGLPRGVAVASIFLTGLVVVAGFLALVLPTVIREIAGLVAAAPGYLERAQQDSSLLADLDQRFNLIEGLQSLGRNLPTTVLSFVRSFTAFVFNTLTVIILTIYFATAMPGIRRGVAALLERERREEFEGILEESIQRVGGYVLGQLTLGAIAGVTTFIALSVLGIPYAAALAFWVALTDLIPTIGALLGALVGVVVAAFVGLPQFIGTAAFFLVYQQVENYVIGPRVMRQAIDMSAAAVITAVLIGGSLAGFVGALLALPVAAIIKITVRELFVERRVARVREADAELDAERKTKPVKAAGRSAADRARARRTGSS